MNNDIKLEFITPQFTREPGAPTPAAPHRARGSKGEEDQHYTQNRFKAHVLEILADGGIS